MYSYKANPNDDCHLYEMNLETKEIKQLTFGSGVSDIEPKYLPGGKIVFNSSRCIQTVDCWVTPVMNLYICDADGSNIMRVGYDQVHTTYPTVTEDGRVIYTRWDYNDRNQMFIQGIFQMQPDGRNQTEVFGNNSNFPTTLLHTRSVPGYPGVYVSIASGHHNHQIGKLALIDTSKGVIIKLTAARLQMLFHMFSQEMRKATCLKPLPTETMTILLILVYINIL